MIFTRTKKLTFFNNKGGVGKTTLAFNVAVKFAQSGYKTVLIDLDPQCNLTRLALGDEYVENTIFSATSKTVYDMLHKVINGGGDIDMGIGFEKTRSNIDNLYLLRGDLRLSEYEDLLSTAYNQAAAGQGIGFFQTSAIQRFLNEKALDDKIDIFIIDTSPTLGLLNRIILLGTDYFVVPVQPDAFSLQGIENLGVTLEKWKKQWSDTATVMAKRNQISSDQVLDGEGLFIGYILNSYNIYGQKPIRDHEQWINKIPISVKEYLSERHSRNGLVEKSSAGAICSIQDYGRLPSLAHEKGQAIFDINPEEAKATQTGTVENIEKSELEFNNLANNILGIINQY
jgi:cellulose biosynthesis protein BcsQ